jgi:hypothetical protein
MPRKIHLLLLLVLLASEYSDVWAFHMLPRGLGGLRPSQRSSPSNGRKRTQSPSRRSQIVCELKLNTETESLIIPPLTFSVFGDIVQPTMKNKPVFAKFVSWILQKFVEARMQFVSGLEVNVLSQGNRHILRGRVDALEMKFDKLIFADIFVSGGGRLILQDVDLRMRRFLFQNLQSVRKPYKIYGDFLLTQADIVNSKLIRSLIQLLTDTILERAFEAVPLRPSSLGLSFTQAPSPQDIVKVNIKKVGIRARKLFALGEVTLSSQTGSASGVVTVPFEVSTGAGTKDNGRVLFLKDIQVVLNPDSILRAVLPILLTSPIDVDLGENFSLESLVIANKHVWLRANAVISPVAPFHVTPVESKALYQFDLAALLSNLMRLKGGIALPWIYNKGNNEDDNNTGDVDVDTDRDPDDDHVEDYDFDTDGYSRRKTGSDWGFSSSSGDSSKSKSNSNMSMTSSPNEISLGNRNDNDNNSEGNAVQTDDSSSSGGSDNGKNVRSNGRGSTFFFGSAFLPAPTSFAAPRISD